MRRMQSGSSWPDLEVEATGGYQFRLPELKNYKVVIYFYPKDNTSGCTRESQDFRDQLKAFGKLDSIVLGVSRDSLQSHENFKAKYGFQFELISDPNEILCRTFDVIREKSLYGRKYLGVDRSTFLFDKRGILQKIWRGVRVGGHVDEVLDAVKAI